MHYHPSMGPVLDIVCKQLRGPLATTRSGLVTWARIFTHQGRLYVAETPRRGADVRSVTEYPMPEQPWDGSRSFGEWKWQTCGCGNQWGRWTPEQLVAMVMATEPEDAESMDDLIDADQA